MVSRRNSASALLSFALAMMPSMYSSQSCAPILSRMRSFISFFSALAVLTEEVGELARIMARTYGDQSFKKGEKHDLSDEMADVLWVLICLANQTGVDLTEAFKRNLEKKTNRDKERHLNNPKLQ